MTLTEMKVEMSAKIHSNSYANYKCWFIQKTKDVFDVVSAANRTIKLGTYNAKDKVFSGSEEQYASADMQDNVAANFANFVHRPEYTACTLSREAVNHLDGEQLVCTYFDMMVGLALIRAGKAAPNQMLDEAKVITRIFSCIDWLFETDFVSAPASTYYHENFPGGLLLHSLKVAANIIDLCELPQFASADISSAVFIALTHDWCKIGLYEPYTKKQPDASGNWVPTTAYRHKPSDYPFGHGTTSMFLAQKWFRVSFEEALAIRWHMGRWYVSESEMNDLQNCNETYPLVHLLQFADQLAIVKYA